MSQETVYIYTDASFSQAHKIAIIGHFFLFDNEKLELSKRANIPFFLEQISETNNIRAEIRSALVAIQMAPADLKVVLYTDCESICKLLSRRGNLEKTNFMSQRHSTPLNNTDLYKEFFKIMDSIQPELIWVKGHCRDRGINSIQNNFSYLDQKVRKQLRKVVSEITPSQNEGI
jgi:ribonuclease HI